MAAYSRVAIVTGGNKGIGLAIVRQLALQYASSSFNNGPLLIYLTARDETRGRAAVQDLYLDAQLVQAKALLKDGGLSDVKFAELDIMSSDSIHRFEEFLRAEHPNGIDILVNNAGMIAHTIDNEAVEKTLATNYYGTVETSISILPLIRSGGRLVNVSSLSGKTGQFSSSLQRRFQATSTITDVNLLMEDFRTSAAEGTLQEKGWTAPVALAYCTSKAGLTAATRILADEEAKKGLDVLVNSCCPGWVNTDMTKGRGTKTPDEGAQTPVLLALGDIGRRTGLFWTEGSPISEV